MKLDEQQIQHLNNEVKYYEKHTEISILKDDVRIDCAFCQYISFDKETLCFSIKNNEENLFIIEHNYKTGLTLYQNSKTEVVLADLFSKRHFRSILFFAWDTYRQYAKRDLNKLTAAIHKQYPVPIIKTESESGKKHWIKVDSIDLKKNSIVMDGIMTMTVSDYISSPIKTSCVYNIKNGTVSLTYRQNGELMKEDCKEKVLFESPLKPENIFFAAAKISNKKILDEEIKADSPYTLDVLRMSEGFMFRMLSKAVPDLVLFIICGVNSVSDDMIEFSICDGKRPYTKLFYKSKTRQIYIYRQVNSGMNLSKLYYKFIHENDGCEKMFNDIVNIINKNT